jgi:hypothetical protein
MELLWDSVEGDRGEQRYCTRAVIEHPLMENPRLNRMNTSNIHLKLSCEYVLNNV